ncbi:pentapeptide repeat-containing protein [Aerosakkonema funiforme]|uniref:pentapeptide repeat-containing protein n=1 Tax=Aerosakkonema funiforme TaxID=1246630 RepID=UPI0035B913D0
MKRWKYCLKVQIIGSAILLNFVPSLSPVNAFNASQVTQLLQTKECSRCDLTGANLSGADLSFAILTDANLTAANLQNANLSQADLSRANLSKANLSRSNLNRAYLTNANLDGTNLLGASVQGTRGLPIFPIANIPTLNLPPLRLSQRRSPPLPSLRLRPIPLPPPPPSLRLPPIPPAPVLPPPLRLPTATPVRIAPSPVSRQPTSAQISPNWRLPAQDVSQLPSHLAEVNRYFVNRWKSPANLTTSLVYTLLLNNDGSIKQIIPHGKVDETYLDRTEMPLLGERFVSPFPSGQTNKIRLILMPGGRVFTFPEP